MTSPTPSVSWRRLAVALASAVGLILAAPFVGVVRGELRALFPRRFTLVIYAIVGIAVLATTLASLRRIHDRRLARVGVLAGAMLAAVAYVGATGNPDPSIRAVETFHFVQYGAVTYLFHLAWRHRDDGVAYVLPALAAFIVGTAEEAYQWFLPARVGELKDVWINGVAIACGVVVSTAVAPPAPYAGWARHATRQTCLMLAGALVTLAAFVHLVHLGYDVRDGDVTFASRFTAAELARADDDRRARWRAHPPLVRPDRMSREDQYMTEGLQHVQARNAAWSGGAAVTAWHENAILERHFASVLDTPSYVAPGGHRWPAAQRDDAASRAQAGSRSPFTSRAYPYPIYTWSPVALWLATLGAAALLWRIGGRGVTP